jgi:MFS family permease
MANVELTSAAKLHPGHLAEEADPLPAPHEGSPGVDDGPRHRPTLPAHHIGFWIAAMAFLVNMGFSAVPTPLYVLYQQRDHFSDLMVTIVYAVYAVGVVASLFLGGHLSDWMGRRRIFVLAIAANVASAIIFIFEPSLAGLIVARIVSGISVGLTTATATSYLAELHLKARPFASGRRAEVVATASNLGGIGFGPLAAGLLAQFASDPLQLTYVVFGVTLVVLAVTVACSPETVLRPDSRPIYHPQRIAVPSQARGTFFAATFAGMAAFAVYGVFNSLVPSFLAGTLHENSHAVAGAVAFAAFAAGAVAQIAQARVPNRVLLRRSVPTIVIGLGLLAGAMWAGDLVMFVIGGVITGAGAGMVFKGSLTAAASVAPDGSKAEVLSGFFLGAYVGLSIPVVGLGVATTYAPARDVMLAFVVLAAVAIAASVRALVSGRAGPGSPHRQTPDVEHDTAGQGRPGLT